MNLLQLFHVPEWPCQWHEWIAMLWGFRKGFVVGRLAPQQEVHVRNMGSLDTFRIRGFMTFLGDTNEMSAASQLHQKYFGFEAHLIVVLQVNQSTIRSLAGKAQDRLNMFMIFWHHKVCEGPIADLIFLHF